MVSKSKKKTTSSIKAVTTFTPYIDNSKPVNEIIKASDIKADSSIQQISKAKSQVSYGGYFTFPSTSISLARKDVSKDFHCNYIGIYGSFASLTFLRINDGNAGIQIFTVICPAGVGISRDIVLVEPLVFKGNSIQLYVTAAGAAGDIGTINLIGYETDK